MKDLRDDKDGTKETQNDDECGELKDLHDDKVGTKETQIDDECGELKDLYNKKNGGTKEPDKTSARAETMNVDARDDVYVGPWHPPWIPAPKRTNDHENEQTITCNEGNNYRASKAFAIAKGIAERSKGVMIDSGASGAYIAIHDADLAEWETNKKPSTTVFQADGTHMTTGAEGNFVISSDAASYNIRCTQLHKLSQSVVGIRPLMDAIPKCTVVFSKTKVEIKSDGVLVMTGHHEPSDGLWYIDLAIRTQAERVFIQRSYQQHVYLQSMADKVAFLHGCIAFLPLTSYYKAVKHGWIQMMGIEAKHIQQNPPDIKHTAKGYLRRNAHGYHSTKRIRFQENIDAESESDDDEEVGENDGKNAVFSMTMRLENAVHADASGELHPEGKNIKNARGKNRLHVTVHPDTGFILLHFMKDGETTKSAVMQAICRIKDAGHDVKWLVADSGIGAAARTDLAKKGININLVPPQNHRANKAERGIDLAKRTILGMLAGASKDFSYTNADLTEPQAEIVLNITRKGKTKTESAYKSFYGKDYDWDAYPLNIFGTRCEVYRGEDEMTSLSFKTYSGFYVGPALDAYRCYRVLPIGHTAVSTSDTVMFYPETIRTPIKTEGENLADAVDRLKRALVEMKVTTRYDQSVKDIAEKIKKRANELASDERESYLIEESENDHLTMVNEDDGLCLRDAREHAASEGESNDENEDDEVDIEQLVVSEAVKKIPKKQTIKQKDAKQTSKRTTKGAKKAAAAKKRKRAPPDNTNHYSEREKFTPRIRELHSTIQLATDDDTGYEERRQMIFGIYNEDGKLTWEKSQRLPKEQADMWKAALHTEIDRLINKTETAIPIHWNEVTPGKTASYCSLQLEKKPGKPERIRMVYGGDRQETNPLWSSRNSEMVTKKIFANAIVSSGKKLCALDIKDFYIAEMNMLDEPEFMFIAAKDITLEMREEYKEFIHQHTGRLMLKLIRSIYGMRQAGYIAQRNLLALLKANGYYESGYDSIFTSNDGKTIFLTHTDDFAIGYDDEKEVQQLVQMLTEAKYKITIDMEGKNFCGFEVEYNRNAPQPYIALTIEKIIDKAIIRFGYDKVTKTRNTPYPTANATNFTEYDPREMPDDISRILNAKEITLLQEMIGVLRYIAIAVYGHLELCIAKIAANMANPRVSMLEAAQRIFEYLANPANRKRGLKYFKSDMQLYAVSDASYGTETKFRSRTGGFIYLGKHDCPEFTNAPIEVMSVIQKNVATCTVEAEYVAIFDVAQRLAYLKQLVEGMHYPQETIEIECDNQGAVGIATLTKNNRKLRHVAMRYHWVRDQVGEKIIDIIWRRGKGNKADHATKYIRTRDEYYKGRDIYTTRMD